MNTLEVNSQRAELIADHCNNVLDLASAQLSDEYFYYSLPLCVIDAVYSIGVTYTSTRMVVIRYCDYFGLQRIRPRDGGLPPVESQESVEAFLRKMLEMGINCFTNDIFRNKQRTSSCNGILKCEAVYRFCQKLADYKVNYLQDIDKVLLDESFESEIKSIPGQTSGISLQYFFMLAGSDDLIKPDRMILRFLESILGMRIDTREALHLLQSVCELLKSQYPDMTAKTLDHAIWQYQRTQ